MIARVRGVILAATSSTSMLPYSSMSTKTGLAPACEIVSEVEIQLAAVVITSCPAPMPSMRSTM